MSLTVAAWIVILSALVMANLPFLSNRRLAPWPWRPTARTPAHGLLAWALCVAYLLALGGWSWGTVQLVGSAFAGGGSLAGLFLLKLLFSVALAALLLWWPGLLGAAPAPPSTGTAGRGAAAAPRTPSARRPDPAAAKPFIDRFLEALVGYVLVGALGFAFELNLGNAFVQGWEFYAVTLALFLVLGYPGFVWRYMLKRRPPARKPAP